MYLNQLGDKVTGDFQFQKNDITILLSYHSTIKKKKISEFLLKFCI